jgi:hypothetical protein
MCWTTSRAISARTHLEPRDSCVRHHQHATIAGSTHPLREAAVAANVRVQPRVGAHDLLQALRGAVIGRQGDAEPADDDAEREGR